MYVRISVLGPVDDIVALMIKNGDGFVNDNSGGEKEEGQDMYEPFSILKN